MQAVGWCKNPRDSFLTNKNSARCTKCLTLWSFDAFVTSAVSIELSLGVFPTEYMCFFREKRSFWRRFHDDDCCCGMLWASLTVGCLSILASEDWKKIRYKQGNAESRWKVKKTKLPCALISQVGFDAFPPNGMSWLTIKIEVVKHWSTTNTFISSSATSPSVNVRFPCRVLLLN